MSALRLTIALFVFVPSWTGWCVAGESTAADWVEEGRSHWAYQLPQSMPVPKVQDASWPLNPIDDYILARLEATGLRPGPDADRETLLRRLYFDLIGLPPTIVQVDQYLADSNPESYQQLVDRLLASPRFGERWGRHWLDVVRYAESMTLRGLILPDAWRFRDYVINSFNADRPFDQFVREQIAGDLLSWKTISQRRRQLVGVTFLALGNTNLENQDKEQLRMDVVNGQLETIGSAFLAQTLGCARCHDHKFDPIPTHDYYALAGILRNTKTLEHANVSKWLEAPLPQSADEEALQHGGQSKARPPTVMTVREEKEIGDTFIHFGGSVHSAGEMVPRGFLQVANHGTNPQFTSVASGRHELADWLVSTDNPLTARVTANRIWFWLMGEGLVRTPDNFGTTGAHPSHPQLLDYLALRLVQEKWSIKSLIRLIVLSRTYQLDSGKTDQAMAIDPGNRLLSHTHRRRLDAECLRDSMLTVSGELSLQMSGSTIRTGTKADFAYQHDLVCRSVYLPVLRNSLPKIFTAFDFANPNVTTGRRDVSTVAPQALLLMNHPWFYQRARKAAKRLLAESYLADADLVATAYRRTVGRSPTDTERKMTLQYLQSVSASDVADSRLEAITQMMHVLFSTIDFRYLY
jgi:hypothetical protein